MSNKVLLKKSAVAAKVPLSTDLSYGEVAINYADGKLYFKDSSNNIKSFVSSATDLLSLIKTVDGAGSGLDADVVDGYAPDTANTASTIAVRDSSSKITASGHVSTAGLFEHANTITEAYTIASGNNAFSAGPVTVATGGSITIPSGSIWTVV